jgi:hypothetical protein
VTWWCSATGQPWEWAWRAYPGVWLLVLLLGAGGWRVLARKARRAGREPDKRRLAAYLGGVVAVWLALDWPVGALGAGYLLSAHTVQYLLLTFLAAPLMLFGLGEPEPRPASSVARAPGGARRALLSLAIYDGVLALTHIPGVVDGLMPSQLGAAAVDLAWLVAGLAIPGGGSRRRCASCISSPRPSFPPRRPRSSRSQTIRSTASTSWRHGCPASRPGRTRSWPGSS